MQTSTSAVISIYNKRTHQSLTETLSSSTPLCQQDAGWTVEGIVYGVPLPNWGKVEFKDLKALTDAGQDVGLSGAVTLDIVGESLTDVKHKSIDVTYIG